MGNGVGLAVGKIVEVGSGVEIGKVVAILGIDVEIYVGSDLYDWLLSAGEDLFALAVVGKTVIDIGVGVVWVAEDLFLEEVDLLLFFKGISVAIGSEVTD